MFHLIRYEDLDKAVYTWFVQKCCQEFPVSGIMIVEKMLIISDEQAAGW